MPEAVEVALMRLSTQMDNVVASIEMLRGDMHDVEKRYIEERSELFAQKRKIDRRVQKIEFQLRIVRWIGGTAVTILLILAGAWLKGILGL
jgi:ABC-type Fe3+-siderophore transport system permease subunit